MDVLKNPDSKRGRLLLIILAAVCAFLFGILVLGSLGTSSAEISTTAAGLFAFAIIFAAVYLDGAPMKEEWRARRRETHVRASELLERLDAAEKQMKEQR